MTPEGAKSAGGEHSCLLLLKRFAQAREAIIRQLNALASMLSERSHAIPELSIGRR
jgi:hypothetical protein